MEKELQFFLDLSNLVNDSLIKNLSEENIPQKSVQGKKEKPKAKDAKDLGELEPKPKKEAKIQTISLTTVPDSDSSSQSDSEGEPQIDNSEVKPVSEPESDNEGAKQSFQFSKVSVPGEQKSTSVPRKNKYQKLREAAYRDKINAQNPDSQWENVVKTASGQKVELTKDQLLAKFKKDKKEKAKKFEKKKEKEEKAKKAEERKAKAAEWAKTHPKKHFNDDDEKGKKDQKSKFGGGKKFGSDKKFGGKKFGGDKKFSNNKAKFSHK